MSNMFERFIGAAFNPINEIPKFANEYADGKVLIHTLINSIILASICFIIYFETITILGLLIEFVILFVLVFFTTLIIEYIIYILIKQKNLEGVFWKQLNVTNTYLTPLLILFVIKGIILILLPFNCDFLGYLFEIILARYLFEANVIKLKVLHDMKDVFMPSVVYLVCTIIAYLLFTFALLLPLLLIIFFDIVLGPE
jgi:hypothetical protein